MILYNNIMTSTASTIVIEIPDLQQLQLEKLYHWRYNQVLELHQPPLSFEKQPDPWLCLDCFTVDAATMRKRNYFQTLKAMEALYITHIPACCLATFIITKNGVYCIRTCFDGVDWLICPIYLFHETLTETQLKILDQLTNFSLGNKLPIISLHKIDTPLKKGWVQKYKPGDESSCRRFESILRLIPGTYHNGAWKQLDGFFGVYYNEETHELTEYFPE